MNQSNKIRASLAETISVRNVVPVAPAAKPIRTAVVGLGHRSAFSAVPKFLSYDEFQLLAVCDRRPEAVDTVMTMARDDFDTHVNGYTDYSEMLASEQLDAVCVQIDPDKQIPLAVQAMNSGCHVMIEVPVTYDLKQCWDLVVAQERTGKYCLLMEQLRYSGYIRAWRQIIADGIIGKVLFAEGEYFSHKTDAFFQDDRGQFYTCDEALTNPDAKPTWRHLCAPIGYLPHELSPILYAIDDRVIQVTGMSTRARSYRYGNLDRPDIQVALMHTEHDAILRMAVGHNTAAMNRGMLTSHWHHVKGTQGALETPRSEHDKCKMYVDGWEMPSTLEVPWTMARASGPAAAQGSGHGDLDYYTFACFADVVLRQQTPEFDIYQICDTAAPAILAIKSIEEGSTLQLVPDFRPGPNREAGVYPEDIMIGI